jgi:hypothetical protein
VGRGKSAGGNGLALAPRREEIITIINGASECHLMRFQKVLAIIDQHETLRIIGRDRSDVKILVPSFSVVLRRQRVPEGQSTRLW